MAYPYQRLHPGQIRLCRIIENENDSGVLQLELQYFSFGDMVEVKEEEQTKHTIALEQYPARPGYTALSYTWGEAVPEFEIILDGTLFKVRKNLHEFLRAAYALREFETWFWIDQLCINQSDNIEKSWVVGQMSEIFVAADSVRVWLGERNELTDAAFSTVRLIEEAFDNKSEADWVLSDQDIDAIRPNYEAVEHLCSRPYWTRRWILPEVWSARRLCLQCGDNLLGSQSTIPKKYWNFSVALASAVSLSCDRIDIRTLFIAGRVYVQGEDHGRTRCLSCSLIFEMYRGECHDPRDCVFALMPMITPDQRIAVDYSIPPVELFWRIVDSILADTIQKINTEYEYKPWQSATDRKAAKEMAYTQLDTLKSAIHNLVWGMRLTGEINQVVLEQHVLSACRKFDSELVHKVIKLGFMDDAWSCKGCTYH